MISLFCKNIIYIGINDPVFSNYKLKIILKTIKNVKGLDLERHKHLHIWKETFTCELELYLLLLV